MQRLSKKNSNQSNSHSPPVGRNPAIPIQLVKFRRVLLKNSILSEKIRNSKSVVWTIFLELLMFSHCGPPRLRLRRHLSRATFDSSHCEEEIDAAYPIGRFGPTGVQPTVLIRHHVSFFPIALL